MSFRPIGKQYAGRTQGIGCPSSMPVLSKVNNKVKLSFTCTKEEPESASSFKKEAGGCPRLATFLQSCASATCQQCHSTSQRQCSFSPLTDRTQLLYVKWIHWRILGVKDQKRLLFTSCTLCTKSYSTSMKKNSFRPTSFLFNTSYSVCSTPQLSLHYV